MLQLAKCLFAIACAYLRGLLIPTLVDFDRPTPVLPVGRRLVAPGIRKAPNFYVLILALLRCINSTEIRTGIRESRRTRFNANSADFIFL